MTAPLGVTAPDAVLAVRSGAVAGAPGTRGRPGSDCRAAASAIERTSATVRG